MDGKTRTEKTQDWIDSIETTRLLTKLNNHALGEDDQDMSPTQIQAARELLSRSMPVQRIIDMTAHVEGKVQLEWLGEDSDSV